MPNNPWGTQADPATGLPIYPRRTSRARTTVDQHTARATSTSKAVNAQLADTLAALEDAFAEQDRRDAILQRVRDVRRQPKRVG